MARQGREAHGKIKAVAETNAERAVGLRAVRCSRRPRIAATRCLVLPHAVAATARHVDVVRAAVIAGQLAYDVVLVGSARRTDDVLTARLEVRQAPLRDIDLAGQVLALRRVAERLREQELVIAAPIELRLTRVEGAIDDANFIFDARKLIARLVTLRPLLHEALLELVADRVLRRIVGGGSRGGRSRHAGRGRNAWSARWRR